MATIVALSIALVAYNAATNLLPVPRWTYVPTNVALTVALVWWSHRRGLGWDALGLHPDALTAGVRWGLGAAAVVAVGVAVAVAYGDAVGSVARLLMDERAVGIAGTGLLYETLLRVPLGTALFEEVAFRGVLLAEISRSHSVIAAVLASSVVFGLWHIGPSLATVRLNEPHLAVSGQALAVAGAVAATTVAGVIFCVLRLASGSLLAPILTHWATNAFGLVGAVVFRRLP